MFNSKYKKILKQVLKDISVPEKERAEIQKSADDLMKQLEKQKLKAFIGGSLAKNTIIKKKNQDVDIFVPFDSEAKTKTLGNVLKKLKTKGKLVTIHGSRDYFRITHPTFALEIIPTVKIKKPEDAQNITDISMFHVTYIKKKTKRNPKLANEIKLAKVFCEAADCYGAESYIQGFSGYALEVLICHFGSFLKFLRSIDKEEIIDPEHKFKNKKQVKRELNASKLLSPIILVDPTYKYRNVTAALSQETFNKFIKYKNQFLKKPTDEAFQNKIINKDEIQNYANKNKANYLEIKISTNKQEGDIAGTKMKKFHNFLIHQFKNKQQEVLLTEFDYQGTGKKATGYLVVKETKRIEIKGPELTRKEQVIQFRKVRKEVFERNGSIWAMEDTSINKIFNKTKKQQGEMGVKATLNKQ
jgi:tRNA CCA-adding enzyme